MLPNNKEHLNKCLLLLSEYKITKFREFCLAIYGLSQQKTKGIYVALSCPQED